MTTFACIQLRPMIMQVLFCRFSSDTASELELVRKLCLESGAHAAVVADHWAKGGAGAVDLGNAVIEACKFSRAAGSPFRCDFLFDQFCFHFFEPSSFEFLSRFLYPLEFSLKDKIATICKEIYGADNVEYSELAEKRIEVISRYN
jgi:methylenetetrahydrofolate dehydrogenase (NADP+)/methenyltetrahydrofolate cyclohydrolase/formyltetrahydrofolate synthetase